MNTPETTGDSTESQSARPVLRVVKGNPTDEDIAVLVTVLASGRSAPEPPPDELRNDWGRPIDRLRPAWGSPSSFLRF